MVGLLPLEVRLISSDSAAVMVRLTLTPATADTSDIILSKNINKHQSRHIASFLFARWQQQFVIACFGWESGTPSNTMCHRSPQVYMPNDI